MTRQKVYTLIVVAAVIAFVIAVFAYFYHELEGTLREGSSTGIATGPPVQTQSTQRIKQSDRNIGH
jgi:hypothetical protein